jgi:hypothetical protein
MASGEEVMNLNAPIREPAAESKVWRDLDSMDF